MSAWYVFSTVASFSFYFSSPPSNSFFILNKIITLNFNNALYICVLFFFFFFFLLLLCWAINPQNLGKYSRLSRPSCKSVSTHLYPGKVMEATATLVPYSVSRDRLTYRIMKKRGMSNVCSRCFIQCISTGYVVSRQRLSINFKSRSKIGPHILQEEKVATPFVYMQLKAGTCDPYSSDIQDTGLRNGCVPRGCHIELYIP